MEYTSNQKDIDNQITELHEKKKNEIRKNFNSPEKVKSITKHYNAEITKLYELKLKTTAGLV